MSGEKANKTEHQAGKRKKIGNILLEAGLIKQDQMKEALRKQAVTGERLGHLLVSMGFISEENMVGALSKQLRFPSVDLGKLSVSEELLNILPFSFILKNQVIPVERDGNILKVAMVNPLDRSTIGDIEFMVGATVQPLVTTTSAMERFLDGIRSKSAEGAEEAPLPERIEVMDKSGGNGDSVQVETEARSPNVTKILNKILSDAIRSGANYIHIKPRQQDVMVRYRIDGILRNAMTFSAQIYPPLLSRLKTMARMDMTMKERPQSGSTGLKVGEQTVNFLISAMPTLGGEKVVIRILGKNQKMRNLENLGMHPKDLSSYYNLLSRPDGIVMVAGPAGSGTSTTLYTSLRFLRSEEKSIITIEDPVEYEIPGINQIQVNPREGITFVSGLRSVFQQDPDVVMVSEIQDLHTAQLVFQSALRGHLVLSSLYTNNAVSAVAYLMNLDVKLYTAAASIVGIVAQRLVRRNCPHCLEKYIPEPRVLAGLNIDVMQVSKMQFYRSCGCKQCQGIGYVGQIGIFEILTIDYTIKELILRRASERAIFMAAREKGMTTMEENGLYLVLNKITTLEEVLRVIPSDQIATRRKGDWEKHIISLFDEAIYLL